MQGRSALIKSSALRILFVVLAALMSGCATPPQTAQLLAQRPTGLPPAHQIPSVSYFAQDALQCGPASLAMVLNHWGARTTPQELTPQMFTPGREGSLQLELLAASRRQGMLAVPIAPRLPAVLAEVAAGNPVIVLQNLSLPIAPVWHYAVVIGYDLNAQTITLHSGPTAHASMTLTAFENTWARGQHWAVTVTPPARLPTQASEADVLAAAAALERVNASAAQTAYRAMTTRWPAASGAWIGLGNIEYARKAFAQAARAYEQAVRHAPESADAWHNLAWAYDALGERTLAVQFAQQAVLLGGPRLARYQESLQTLRSK